MHQPVHLRDRETADHADIAGRRHRTGDDAREIRGILDVIVEDGEVRIGRIVEEGRAEQKGGVGIIQHHFARFLLDAEDLADDQIGPALGIFAHHPRIVGVGGVFRVGVLDLPRRLGGLGGDVDAAHPLLFDRYGVDPGDLDRVLGEQPSGQRRGAREGERARAPFEKPAAAQPPEVLKGGPMVHGCVPRCADAITVLMRETPGPAKD